MATTFETLKQKIYNCTSEFTTGKLYKDDSWENVWELVNIIGETIEKENPNSYDLTFLKSEYIKDLNRTVAKTFTYEIQNLDNDETMNIVIYCGFKGSNEDPLEQYDMCILF